MVHTTAEEDRKKMTAFTVNVCTNNFTVFSQKVNKSLGTLKYIAKLG